MKPFWACSKFSPSASRSCDLDRDAGFELDVGGCLALREEAPARRFEQLIDLDAGGGFFHSSNIFNKTQRRDTGLNLAPQNNPFPVRKHPN